MASSKYYGRYKSATSSVTGCQKEFSTVPRDENLFPLSLNYKCDQCEKVHLFNFRNYVLISTDSFHKKFNEFCKENGIETDVVI